METESPVRATSQAALDIRTTLVKRFSVGIPSTGLLPQGIQAWPLEGPPQFPTHLQVSTA